MTAIRDIPLKLRVLHRAWRMRVRADSVQVRLILRHLGSGDVAVDVGSHKGGFSYWMRRAVGPAGSVYAFEPQPESARYQRQIVRAFGFENVVVEPLAVSSARGTATFTARAGGFHPGGRLGSAEPAADEISFPVETVTLDHYFETARRPVSLIKIDAEGHEREILRGARRILTEDWPLLLFECERHRHRRHSIRPTLDSLLELGYCGRFIQGSRLVDLSRFEEERHQVGSPADVINFAFSPPEGRAPGRHGTAFARYPPTEGPPVAGPSL